MLLNKSRKYLYGIRSGFFSKTLNFQKSPFKYAMKYSVNLIRRPPLEHPVYWKIFNNVETVVPNALTLLLKRTAPLVFGEYNRQTQSPTSSLGKLKF